VFSSCFSSGTSAFPGRCLLLLRQAEAESKPAGQILSGAGWCCAMSSALSHWRLWFAFALLLEDTYSTPQCCKHLFWCYCEEELGLLRSARFLSGRECCAAHSTRLALKQRREYTFYGFFSVLLLTAFSVVFFALFSSLLSLFLFLCSSFQRKQNLEDLKLLWYLTCNETCGQCVSAD